MSSNVTALVVAVAGVAGTLASAVITQVLAMRSRSREIEAQDNQREKIANKPCRTRSALTSRPPSRLTWKLPNTCRPSSTRESTTGTSKM
jgi:archaellum component FlaG (FlaF/FlaG flagellin family)